MSLPTVEQYRRAQLLAGTLAQVRHEAQWLGAGDVIHRLINVALAAAGALKLVEMRLATSQSNDVDQLLDFAEARLRECRAIIVCRQHG